MKYSIFFSALLLLLFTNSCKEKPNEVTPPALEAYVFKDTFCSFTYREVSRDTIIISLKNTPLYKGKGRMIISRPVGRFKVLPLPPDSLLTDFGGDAILKTEYSKDIEFNGQAIIVFLDRFEQVIWGKITMDSILKQNRNAINE
jgi:hypothetical protein